jgi:hypothetical protein
VQGLQERTGVAPGKRHSSRIATEGTIEMPDQEDCGRWSGRSAKVISNTAQKLFGREVCLAPGDKRAGHGIEEIHARIESLDLAAYC